ncbi:SAM-dependent chlorinase/fluorinase [Parafrankia sp. EUN1f]|uniref:SAM-dependent chlorinase/fluorinase n=1 Tax=Parafrankia sp. EUN1f TaxID=102897 RepID=UPI002101A2B5|nr:SAM-dependent chlorinase/fluorinase [Parafrankia sp. EUN1f]
MALSEYQIISFLTDYGLSEGFVATCHEVLLGISPGVRLIDISHVSAAPRPGLGPRTNQCRVPAGHRARADGEGGCVESVLCSGGRLVACDHVSAGGRQRRRCDVLHE